MGRYLAAILFVCTTLQACASPAERTPPHPHWLIRFHASCSLECQQEVLKQLGVPVSRRSSKDMVLVPRGSVTREQLERRPEIRAVSDNPVLHH